MPHEERISRILAKLAALRAGAIGDDVEKFSLEPVLSEGEITAFEQAQGAQLPADFRAFLALAGGSGAGPYDGLLPMIAWGSALGKERPGWLARPFPFVVTETGQFEPFGPAREASTVEPPGPTHEAYEGAISLSDQGCTFYGLLVVTGPLAGRLVYVNVDQDAPYYLVENPDFLSWYERWLDELRWGHRASWFGIGMPGDEAQLVAAAAPGSARRRDAVAAMFRLPRLSGETAALVVDLLRDPDAELRELAVSLLKNFPPAEASLHLHRALGDVSGEVRKAALETILRAGGAWQEAARKALHDTDPAVARVALYHLTADERLLSADEVLPFVESPDAALSRCAMGALARLPSGRATAVLLGRVASDPELDTLSALVNQVHNGGASAAQTDEVLEALRARVVASGDRVPQLLLWILGGFPGSHPALQGLLLGLVNHPEVLVRFSVVHQLGKVGDEGALAALAACRRDPSRLDPEYPNRSSIGTMAREAARAIRKRVRGG
jgi:HEAT repeat protein